jgi:hypothetical protein
MQPAELSKLDRYQRDERDHGMLYYASLLLGQWKQFPMVMR